VKSKPAFRSETTTTAATISLSAWI